MLKAFWFQKNTKSLIFYAPFSDWTHKVKLINSKNDVAFTCLFSHQESLRSFSHNPFTQDCDLKGRNSFFAKKVVLFNIGKCCHAIYWKKWQVTPTVPL